MYPPVSELAVDGIPVVVSCRVLGLARQPYYRWLDTPIADSQLDEAYLANAIHDAHRDDPEFGYRFHRDRHVDRTHLPPPTTPSPPRPIDPHRLRDHPDPSDGGHRLNTHCHLTARQSRGHIGVGSPSLRERQRLLRRVCGARAETTTMQRQPGVGVRHEDVRSV